jgi:hypothetical protein
MSAESRAWAKPRPLRVAFLIEDGEYAHLALDGIFADCYGRWGGRFSLIVPCVAGQIPLNYWPWLEAYDPDIVYSYVPLSQDVVLELHERLSLAQYLFHKRHGEPRLDVFGFKPDYRFAPLSSLSVIFRLARHSRDGAPVKIIDSWHTEKPSRLLTDNLGTYHFSAATGMYPPDARSSATLLTIVAPEKVADRRFGVPQDLDMVPHEAAALDCFARRQATTLSAASALFASKLEVTSHRFGRSFNLVVGDSFADRILFWNARLFIPAWLDSDLSCFRVAAQQLDDPVFLTTLGEILKRNHVTGGAGGQPHLTVRSTSLNAEQLAAVRNTVLSTRPWSTVSAEVIASLDELLPTDDALREARESNRFGDGFFARPDWTRFVWTEPSARPPILSPDHLSDAPSRQAFTQGYWCNDFTFQYGGTAPRFADNNVWALPRRWRVAGAFKITYASTQHHALPPVQRRVRGGGLGVFVCGDHPIESICVPNAYEAVHHALAVDGRWARTDAEHGDVYPSKKVGWIDPSNEARYLTGVLGMAGGLRRAEQLLLHPFLQATWAKLGGSPNVAAADVTPVINRLQKRARREAVFDLTDEGERRNLAVMIGWASRLLKTPLSFVAYDDLRNSWKAHREGFWAAHQQPRQADDGVDWDGQEEASLDGCLIDLRRRQMMFQGHRWTCRRCHHKNWVDMSELIPEMACGVCKKTEFAPVNIRWLFRANEFLIESLRDHSVLSLVWALSALRHRARRSFVFVEPTWFGFDEQAETADAEADLLALIDGQAFLCEVKSSWHSLRPSHIDDLVALAQRVRPDTALLAVMEAGAEHVAKLDAARARLAEVGIKLELLTLDGHSVNDDSYLASWDDE